MKTIIRKVNFRYFFRGSLYLLVISFLLAGCEEEASLSARSVVEAGETERERWNIGGTKMQCRMEAISTRRKLPM